MLSIPKINFCNERIQEMIKQLDIGRGDEVIVSLIQLDDYSWLNTNLGFKLFRKACVKGSRIIVQFLLEKLHSLIDRVDVRGIPPLFLSLICNNLDVSYLLIKSGCMLNVQDISNTNVFHIIASLRIKENQYHLYSKIREEIYSKYPELIHKENEHGELPIHLACISGNVEMIEWLISKGADLEKRTNNGKTPLEYSDCCDNYFDTERIEKLFKNQKLENCKLSNSYESSKPENKTPSLFETSSDSSEMENKEIEITDENNNNSNINSDTSTINNLNEENQNKKSQNDISITSKSNSNEKESIIITNNLKENKMFTQQQPKKFYFNNNNNEEEEENNKKSNKKFKGKKEKKEKKYSKFKNTIKELKFDLEFDSRLESKQFLPYKKGEPFRILSLDGGGIKCILQCIILERLLEKRPQLLTKTHLICGVSASSILTVILGMGFKLNTALNLMREVFRETFKTHKHKNGLSGYEFSNKYIQIFAETLCEKYKLSDIQRRIFIPSFCIDTGKESEKRGFKCMLSNNFIRGNDELLIDACCRSAAAPGYFKTYQACVDGGILSNQPCSLAWPIVIGQKGLDVDIKDIITISISAGAPATKYFDNDKMCSSGYLQWASKVTNLFMFANREMTEEKAKYLFDDKYFRFNPELPVDVDLSDVEKLDELEKMAREVDIKPLEDFIDKYWL